MNKYIFKAIMDKYTASAALKTALTGGMYLYKYPQQHNEPDIYPYCVFFPVSDVKEYTFREQADNCLIQFSIYDNADSIATVQDAGETLKSVFDFASLTVTGYNHISMMQEYSELYKDDDFWHYVITYRLEIQKARS
jgi:hypothetical protein